MGRNLRILFLLDFFSFLGGTEAVNFALLKGLKERGHDLAVCVGEEPSFPTWPEGIRALDIPLYTSGAPYHQPHVLDAERTFVERQVGPLLEAWKPDVIFAHPPGRLLIAFLEMFPRLDIPVVAMEHTVPGENTAGWYHLSLPGIQHRITMYIAKCRQAEEGLRSYYGYQGPIVRIPNPVLGGPKAEPSLQGELLSIGCVARLSPEKGIGFLLGAWRKVSEQVPGATLHLYGHGLHEDYYRTLAQDLGLTYSVVFEGTFSPVTGLAEVAKRHRIFVQPSLFESIPNAMIELLLWKKAFVASRVGGIPELLHPEKGEGVLVDPASTDQLAEALIRLLRDEALADSMAEKSWRAARETYAYPTVITRYEAAMQTAAGGKHAP